MSGRNIGFFYPQATVITFCTCREEKSTCIPLRKGLIFKNELLAAKCCWLAFFVLGGGGCVTRPPNEGLISFSGQPYLHESRHLHALNRVRGSGGRFLSTKKLQQPESISGTRNNSTSGSNQNTNTFVFEPHQSQGMETGTSSISNGGSGSFFQHSDHGFPGMSSSHIGGSMQRNGGFMNGSNQHCAPVVR